MLLTLSIRDIVIVERLTIGFHAGLNVLTGETGAGKSILLDALGLALGERADSTLVRSGAKQASVSAVFDVANLAGVRTLVSDNGIEVDDTLVLRRTLGGDGRSRAFVNDEPVSVGFLHSVGSALIEIQVQSESHVLLSAANHRRLLDAYGGHDQALNRVSASFEAWQLAEKALREAEVSLERARAEEAFLRHSVEELAALEPRPNEEEELDQRRAVLKHGTKIREALAGAKAELADNGAVADRMRIAERILDRAAPAAGGRLDAVLDALQRAAIEVDEAVVALESAANDLDLDGGSLEELEDRLFALRAVARKHNCAIGDLAGLRLRFEEQVETIDGSDAQLETLRRHARDARAMYESSAEALSAKRTKTARALEKAITKELKPLKLDGAAFRVALDVLDASAWGADGRDDIAFEAITNAGQPFAPLARIASGGELSRFMLALQVVLAAQDRTPTMVFDEADSGIGGATAAAVGDRLLTLAEQRQVLVVTHSPQVAARGRHHWRIAKAVPSRGSKSTTVSVDELEPESRREEIARMLSGQDVTEEARAQAARLIEQANG